MFSTVSKEAQRFVMKLLVCPGLSRAEPPILQIFVVIANMQVIAMKTQVGQATMWHCLRMGLPMRKDKHTSCMKLRTNEECFNLLLHALQRHDGDFAFCLACLAPHTKKLKSYVRLWVNAVDARYS